MTIPGPTHDPAPVSHHFRNGFGVTGFVLGLLSVFFAWMPLVGVIAWPLAILGLIFGALGWQRTRKGVANNKGLAIAGTVLSLIGLIVCIAWTAAIGNAMDEAPALPPPPAPAAAAPGEVPEVPAATAPDFGQGTTEGGYGKELTVGDLALTAVKPKTFTEDYIGPQACTKVTYRNDGSASVPFNPFDWKFRNSTGAEMGVGAAFNVDNSLSSGNLSPGGSVTGMVCAGPQIKTADEVSAVVYDPGFAFFDGKAVWTD